MTRLVADPQPVYRLLGKQMYGVPGDTATIYSDAAGTILADIQTYPGAAAIAGSQVTVDSYSRTPAFYLPASTDTVYARVLGGPLTPIYARFDDRLDTLAAYVINVADLAYGAVGDNSTDNSDAFTKVNTAVGIAVALKGGARVVMPAGHYKSGVGIAALTGLTVEGDSMGGTILEITSATAHGISGADKRRVTVRDLELLGPGSGSGVGLNLTSTGAATFNCSFENVYLKAFGGDNFHTEALCSSTLRNVRSENAGGKNIYMDNGTSVVMDAVYGNSGAAQGVHLKTMAYCTINGGAADGNTTGYDLEGCFSITVNGSGAEGPAVGFKINGGKCFKFNTPYVRAETSIGYWVTGGATGVIFDAPRETGPVGATASIQVDAGCRAEVNLPDVVTAVNYLGTVKRTTTTTAYLASTGSMTVTADRAANTDFASYTLARAGADKWGFQNRNDSTDDLHIRNLVDGLTAVLVERRTTAPNISLLTSTKDYGGGVGVIYVPNASTAPTTNPTGGIIPYVEGGVWKWRDPSGNVYLLNGLDSAGLLTAATLAGGAASGGNLQLESTTHATRGKILLGSASAYDEANHRLGIGTASPTSDLDLGDGTADVTANLNRGSNASKVAGYQLSTQGTAKWALQLPTGADDVELQNVARGLTGLLVEDRAVAPNISLLTATKSYGGGVGVIYVPNASTNPTTAPTGGGVFFASGGMQKWIDAAANIFAIDGSTDPDWITADNGTLLAATGDPFNATQNRVIVAGVQSITRLRLTKATTITNVHLQVAVAGATVANAFIGVFNAAGTQLGVSADQSTAWQSTGSKTIALTAPAAGVPGYVYVAVLVGSAGTLPQFRGGNGTGGHVNTGIAAAPFRFSTSGSGLTAIAASLTPGSLTASSEPIWVGLS